MNTKTLASQVRGWLVNFLILLGVIALAILIYKLVILPAPAAVGALPQGETPGILDKLGPRSAVAVVIVMVGLVAWVFWLFIQFGRRLYERGYLGPLTSDALARAEIARQEDALREDLRTGKFATDVDVSTEDFRKRYNIPLNVTPPDLIPGVEIDETGRILRRVGESEPGTGTGTGWGDSPDKDYRNLDSKKLLEELEQAREASKPEGSNAKSAYFIQQEINRRFTEGYRQAQLDAYRQERRTVRDQAREHALTLIPGIDVSAFGGGWIFVLEFTTIIFIIFATLALGFVGVLGAEQIGTILAAIAGYVLGKSTTIRGAAGQEILRGSGEPKALMEAVTKQTEIKALYNEEKLKLQRQVEDLQGQLAKSKTIVPGMSGLAEEEATRQVKERGLIADIKHVSNSAAEAGKVFDQSPAASTEVEKGTTVVLFIAQPPLTPASAPAVMPPPAPAPAAPLSPESEDSQ